MDYQEQLSRFTLSICSENQERNPVRLRRPIFNILSNPNILNKDSERRDKVYNLYEVYVLFLSVLFTFSLIIDFQYYFYYQVYFLKNICLSFFCHSARPLLNFNPLRKYCGFYNTYQFNLRNLKDHFETYSYQYWSDFLTC